MSRIGSSSEGLLHHSRITKALELCHKPRVATAEIMMNQLHSLDQHLKTHAHPPHQPRLTILNSPHLTHTHLTPHLTSPLCTWVLVREIVTACKHIAPLHAHAAHCVHTPAALVQPFRPAGRSCFRNTFHSQEPAESTCTAHFTTCSKHRCI